MGVSYPLLLSGSLGQGGGTLAGEKGRGKSRCAAPLCRTGREERGIQTPTLLISSKSTAATLVTTKSLKISREEELLEHVSCHMQNKGTAFDLLIILD